MILTAGVRYMLGSALAFSVMSALVKLVGQHLPSQEIVLARGLVTLAISYILVRRAGVSPWGNKRRLLLQRGLLGFAALSCFYFGLTRLPIAEATVIQYTNPVFTALLAAAFLRERTSASVIAGIVVSLAGVVLVARPAGLSLYGAPSVRSLAAGLGSGAVSDPLATGVALLGAVLSAGAYTTVRRLRDEHPLVVVFYMPLVTTPATIPFVVGHALWPRGVQWLLLLAVGASTQVGQICLTRGLALEPAGRATSIGYTQIIFSALLGALFFGEWPDLQSMLGALLIVAGTLLAVFQIRTSSPSRPTIRGD